MKLRLYFITVVAALGGFLFGFDTAVISGTDPFVVPYFKLDDAQWGWTVSSALVGTIFGSFVAGFPARMLGRRDSLFITAVLYLVSAIGCAFAPTWELLVASRLLGGVGVGLASVLSPMYIAEISPADLRGRLVAVSQLNIVVGILIAYFSNSFLVSFPNNWRYMFGAEAIPAVVFVALLFFVPRSPRWLVVKGRDEQAKKVLESIYSSADAVRKVLEDIEESLRTKSAPFASLFLKKYQRLTLLAFLFGTFNQLSGINVFIYYAPRILQMTGIPAEEALWQTFISVGVTNLVFTVIAMFLIDRFGRRALMLVGSIGLVSMLMLMAAAFFTETYDRSMVMFGLIGFIASFAMSQGAVIWVFLSEIFPNQIRNHGQSLGSFTHWVWNFIVSLSFPVLVGAIGGGMVFSIFALMMVLQFLFVCFMMPETKGKSLEALEHELVSPVNS